ncbi:MAG: branched-chain amino acid transport system II carrier protein [Proteobacteria bacterium]|nr:branched-chain amino acid transport system II carrier protein [Pseudomonadota bacterium]
MLGSKTVLIAGFAMFSMFFGSGNLIFPILIGAQSLNYYHVSIIGLIVTAVIVPVLGLFAMILFDGNRKNFFDILGQKPAFIMTGLMLALMGPFGVVPRCLTVAYGGLQLILPDLNLALFAFIFCLVIAWLIWQENKVIDIIGLILSPLKLGFIATLLVVGLWYAPTPNETTLPQIDAFFTGLKQGYQTMDLIAAFFFSATTVIYLRSRIANPEKNLFRLSTQACLIGAGLLSIAYIGFVTLGASYAPSLQSINPEQMLVAIAGQALGKLTMPFVAATMTIACLATAVILASLFVEFLQQDICQDRINRPVAILITLTISFFISLIGFSAICSILGTILELAYPAFIALTIGNILYKMYGFSFSKHAFWLVLVMSVSLKFLFL